MKKLLTALCMTLPLAAMPAIAQDKKADNPQQGKMAACAAEGKGKKGDEHKAFMKECLSKDAKPAAAPAAEKGGSQQDKMKACAAEGKGKKGDEHKAFMKECLSKDAKPAEAPKGKAADAPKAPGSQQDKMKACAAEGKGKKGDEHKAFMKECLSK